MFGIVPYSKDFNFECVISRYCEKLDGRGQKLFNKKIYDMIFDLEKSETLYPNIDFDSDLATKVFFRTEYPSDIRGLSQSFYYEEGKRFLKEPSGNLYRYMGFDGIKSAIVDGLILFKNPKEFHNHDCNFGEFCNKRYENRVNKLKKNTNRQLLSKYQIPDFTYFDYCEIFDTMTDRLRICCFCDVNDSAHMWNEFAGDSGACIEVDPGLLNIRPYQVSYGDLDGMTRLDYEGYKILMHYSRELSGVMFFNIMSQLYRSIYHKSIDHCMEQEWRFVKVAGKDYVRLLNGNENAELVDVSKAIRHVYLNKDKGDINIQYEELCKANGIDFSYVTPRNDADF